MKKWMLKGFRYAGISAWLALTMFSCNKSDEVTPAQRQEQANTAAMDNSQMIATTQEVLATTDESFDEQGISDGRVSVGGRFEQSENGNDCAFKISGTFSVDSTHPDSVIYSGSLIIDYGDGSSCQDPSHIKKGVLTDNFTYVFAKNKIRPISVTQSITFQNFSHNGKVIDGNLISHLQAGGTSFVEFHGAKITYANGQSASWEGKLTIVNDDMNTKNRGDDTRTITGSLSGVSRDGHAFTADITKAIVFKYACFKRRDIAVSGTLVVTSGGATSTIDYGDGRCDLQYLVITDTATVEHSF